MVSPKFRWSSAPTIISFSLLYFPACPQVPSLQNQSLRVSISYTLTFRVIPDRDPRYQQLATSPAIKRVRLQLSKLKPSQSMSVFHSASRPTLHFSISLQATNKTVTFSDASEIKGAVSTTTIPYDYLVYAVGAETQTFGIPGVKEHACFMKELHDAEKVTNFQLLFFFANLMLTNHKDARSFPRLYAGIISCVVEYSIVYDRCRVRWFPWSESRGGRPPSPHDCSRWWSYRC